MSLHADIRWGSKYANGLFTLNLTTEILLESGKCHPMGRCTQERELNSEFEELLELANAEPRRAIERGMEILARGESQAAEARALRSIGLAYANLGEFVKAGESLEEARSVAEASGDSQVIGEVQMTRAGAFAWSGDQAAALDAITEALSLLEGVHRARAMAQRGAIHYRLGNFSLARDDLDHAVAALEMDGEQMWAGHALTNRGLLNAYEGRLPEAEQDLIRAREHYSALGHRAAVAQAGQNLGWLALRSGDFPEALNFLDEAEDAFSDLGKSLGEIWSDRAEALLAARLVTDAKHIAVKAARELRNTGMQASYADALLQAAQAALLSGDTATAKETARAARQAMEQQGRDGWVAYADYLVMRARVAEGDLDGSDLPAVTGAVHALDSAGLKAEAVHARLLAATIATAAGDYEACRVYLSEAAQSRNAGPAELRVQGWVAAARLRLHDEDRRGAAAAARAGLEVLDSYQATLGGTMARLHVSGHGSELANIGLRLAGESGSARRLFNWMERTRAGALRNLPANSGKDPELVSYLVQFREADAELRRATLNGEPRADLAKRVADLRERVRDTALRADAAASARLKVPTANDVVDLVGSRCLVEIGELEDGSLVAVTLRSGRARHVDLGRLSRAQVELDSLSVALRRLAMGNASAASRAAAFGVVEEATRRLDEMLVHPLRLRDEPVVIVPVGSLYAVPWPLLPSLASGDVVVSPSAALWAQRTRQGAATTISEASVVAGPRLEHSAAEVDRVGGIYDHALRLVEPTAAEASRALDGATIAHVACHGDFRADNPLFSSLEMGDGPLTVYDLESLEQAPQVMVLSACDAGANTSSGGHEVMGLATALLAQGTRSVVANVGLVPDQLATIDLMVDVHRRLREGAGVSAALAAALPPLDYADADSIAARAFVTFGA